MTGGLRIDGVTVSYGKTPAVVDATMSVEPGEAVGILGANGAGKSSLILATYGSVRSRGIVTFDGQAISELPPLARVRAGISLVPQGRQIFPRLTVRGNLALFADALALDPASVDLALERFGVLHERQSQLAGVMSGGEQQMLAVARALLSTPRLLLLDEMGTGLAPRIIDSLIEALIDLRAQGTSMLIAEPAVGRLGRLIERGYVMRRGMLIDEAVGIDELDARYQRSLGLVPVAEDRSKGLH